MNIKNVLAFCTLLSVYSSANAMPEGEPGSSHVTHAVPLEAPAALISAEEKAPEGAAAAVPAPLSTEAPLEIAEETLPPTSTSVTTEAPSVEAVRLSVCTLLEGYVNEGETFSKFGSITRAEGAYLAHIILYQQRTIREREETIRNLTRQLTVEEGENAILHKALIAVMLKMPEEDKDK